MSSPIIGRNYVDQYGIVWVALDNVWVYSEQHGYGLWDNGKGLRPWKRWKNKSLVEAK